MLRNRRLTVLIGTVLYLVFAVESVWSHLDAPRVPLSQLFFEADFVAIARIEMVEARSFDIDGKRSSYEVVTAGISDHYKGEPQARIEFFQYAHGHAHFQPGDTAVLFLEKLDDKHQLSEIGKTGNIHYVSHQVRNTEHRLDQRDIANYQRVLGAYANPVLDDPSNIAEPSSQLQNTLLWMLQSDSPKLAQSALLDWSYAGDGIQFGQDEVDELLQLVRDSNKPIGFRLALLLELSGRGLAVTGTWEYLLKNENEANLILVLRSMADYENSDLKTSLVALLDRPSPFVAESAAMALAHPVYAGAEISLQPLLDSENQRLNYAAIDGLMGINSPLAREMLSRAAENHPNPNVRRLIDARRTVTSG